MTTETIAPAAVVAPVAAPIVSPTAAPAVNGHVPPVDLNAAPPVTKTKEQFIAEKAAAEAKTIADAKAITDAAAADKAKEAEGWQKEYIKIDNPDAQAAIDLMNEAGVSPIEANAIFAKSIETGNLADVDWATLEAKVGAAKARLVRNGVEKYHTDVVSVQNQTKTEVFGIMGSEANWTTVRAWAQAKEVSDPTYKAKVDDYRRAIETGGFAAKAAASALKADYEADAKNGGLGQTNLVRGDGVQAAAAAPLSRQEYMAAIKKAEREGAPAAVKEALHNRRRAGMQAERAQR